MLYMKASQKPHICWDEVRNVLQFLNNSHYHLRILATLEAKTAKISNFWIFWPVIRIFETWSINRITVQNVQKLLILAVLASSVASILKGHGTSFWKFVKSYTAGYSRLLLERIRHPLVPKSHRCPILFKKCAFRNALTNMDSSIGRGICPS